MEYSLSNLNQNTNLNNITITEIVNKLNIIGFEVDEIFSEESTINNSLENIRLLIKIPSNREDLLNQQFFLSELSTIFLLDLYKNWEKIKKNYSFILKQKYLQYYNYKSLPIKSELSDILIYNIELENFKEISSPFWVQRKLLNSGLKSESGFADLINVINIEWGQTINAYPSLGNSKENTFRLERITKIETFVDNSEKKYEISSGSIVVKNELNKILSVIGIVNPILKSFSNKNSKICLEAIFYNIHDNKLLLNTINTKLSFRYLRKIFIENFKVSFQRLLTLLEIVFSTRILPIKYSNEVTFLQLKPKKLLRLKESTLKKILNIEKYNLEIFKKAGLTLVCKTPTDFYFQVPLYRNDLVREIDLIEEYSRIIGYKNFKEIFPQKQINYSKKKEKNILFAKQFFLNYGFQEVLTSSIQDFTKYQTNKITINNPLNNELSILRSELNSKLFEIFENNLRLGFEVKNIFEIGRVFSNFNNKLIEEDKLSGIFILPFQKKFKQPNSEWFLAKGFLECFFENYGYKQILSEKLSFSQEFFHPTKSIHFKHNNRIIGTFGEASPKYSQLLPNMKFPIYVFEINLKYFSNWQMNSSIKVYTDYSKYPAVNKDISFLIEKTSDFYQVKSIIKSACKNLKNVHFFDIYMDKEFQNKINVGIRLEFQSSHQTLVSENIELEVKKITKLLIEKFQVEFRN